MSHDAIQIPEDQNILWQKSYQSFLISLSQGKRNKSKISKWDLSSVQFRHSVMSDSLWPHESQHARPPCPIPTPGVHINSCASSPWCHPTISSSVIPFSSCPESLPASGSFPVSQLFPWGSQSIGVSASAWVLPMNIQDWSPLGWTGWISTLKSLLQHHGSKASILRHSAFFTVQLSHPYMTTGKTIALTRQTFVGKVISLLFNMLVITFLPRSKHLLISWLQSPLHHLWLFGPVNAEGWMQKACKLIDRFSTERSAKSPNSQVV